MKGKKADINFKDNKVVKFQTKHFFQIIRFKNLLLLGLVQLLFWLVISDNFTSSYSLISFLLLLQVTILLAASGNIINDFFDVEADKINKPKKVLIGKVISGRTALSMYFVLTVFSIISGITLAYIQNKIGYGLLFIVISIMLFFYSKSLKKIALLGNFIVSFFVALSIFLPYVFSVNHLAFSEQDISLRNLVLVYVFFAFILNFIREIVKDIEDVDGDFTQNIKTLPIIIGRKRAQNMVFYLTFIPFLAIILLVSSINNIMLMIYSVIFLIIPLGYFMYQIKEAKSNKQIHKLSTLLKIIMFFGILSIILINHKIK